VRGTSRQYMHAYIFCYPDSLATAVPEEFCPAPGWGQ
jgi:hypothetical protein